MFSGINYDVRSLPGVYLGIVMGRHAGFLTAASSLLRKLNSDGPHLIFIPEYSFKIKEFLEQVKKIYDKYGRCIIAVSEGIQDNNGNSKMFLQYGSEPQIYSTTGSFKIFAGTTSVADGGSKDSGGGFGFLTSGGTHAHIFATAYRPGGNNGNYGVQFHNSYANKATGSLLIKDSAKIDLLTLDDTIITFTPNPLFPIFEYLSLPSDGGSMAQNVASPCVLQ